MNQDTAIPQPEDMVSTTDPGDEILKRFRYQISYAGILAIMMVDDVHNIVEIFCELHEDILVKHFDGLYTGIQVKTKDIDLPPFTIEDEAIKKTCVKFVLLEIKYANQFKNYSIVSNAGFDKSKPAVCLNSLIDTLKKGKALKRGSKANAFINNLAKTCRCDYSTVVQSVKKIRTTSFCAIEDIHFKLVNQIKTCSLLRGAQESKIEEIADLILAKTYKASSLHQNVDLIHSYILGLKDEDDKIKNIITSKRVTNKELKDWLVSQKDLPVVLLLKDRCGISDLPKGYRKLEIKMDAGAIDADNIDLIRNFKFSFENHAISWIYKDGIDIAESQYNQIMYITQNLCKEIYDQQKIIETEKGLDMLIKVREELKKRKKGEPDLFFDCTYEHLLGTVGILTESCKIWWSKKFEISE